MTDFAALKAQLEQRLADLTGRAEDIEDDLRHELDADSSEQAIDLADDEALAGTDEVLRSEIAAIRQALVRIENGTYGTCAKCGNPIAEARLAVRPIAALCIECA
jgi:RNA polymerase-binding protein DksA